MLARACEAKLAVTKTEFRDSVEGKMQAPRMLPFGLLAPGWQDLCAWSGE